MEETKTVTTDNQPENKEAPETKVENPAEKKPEENKSNEPTTQELMVEIAKLKRQVDKNASEAKEWKEKYRSTQSEKEVLDAEKAEAEAKRNEEFETMKRTIQVHDLTENFMDLGYPKDLAKKAASAQVDGDTQALLGFQKQYQEQAKKAWEADFIKSRPEINVGGGNGGNTYTKEQFDKMTLIEKTKLKRENEAEYNRLIAL